MKGKFLAMVSLSVWLILPLGAQEREKPVAETELKEGMPRNIGFTNYTGTHEKSDSLEDIRFIGTRLGEFRQQKKERSYAGRYRIVHLVDQQQTRGFDADLFIIESGAKVDHIDNVRTIIGAYLESAYGYSRNEGLTLAFFITIYNAVHRQEVDYVTTHYKDLVTRQLSPKKIGISTHYSQWPGETEILIPLTSKAGQESIADIGSDEITDRAVIEELQKRKDKGLAPRRAITELKEKELEEEREALETQKKDLKEEEKRLKEKKSRLKTEKEHLKKKALSSKDPALQEKLKKEQKTVAAEEEKLKEEEIRLSQKKAKQATRERKLQQREKKVQKERQEIAKDTRETEHLPPLENILKSDKSVLFFLREDDPSIVGQFILVESNSGTINKQAEIQRSYGHSRVEGDGSFIVIGTQNSSESPRLIAIDKKSLTISKKSEHTVSSRGDLISDSQKIYAVVLIDGDHYLGQFSFDLRLLAHSQEPIAPYSSLALDQQGFYAQNAEGQPVFWTEQELIKVS